VHNPCHVTWESLGFGRHRWNGALSIYGISEKATMVNLARIRHTDRQGDKHDQESYVGSREIWSHLDG